MAHPSFYPSKSFFYPLGNTAPSALAEHVAPGADADFLLLGCGDPRNILYTIYSSGLDTTTEARKYDFTCVDLEPAIIARNILLFSLIYSDAYTETTTSIWDIFYHLLLDDAALSLLIKQSQKLANLSVDAETWQRGEYASFIEIGDHNTLEDLHRIWIKYVSTSNFTPLQKERFKKEFVAGMKAVLKDKEAGVDMTAARCAGPFGIEATMVIATAVPHYWRTGVTYTDEDKIKAATNVNPTFAFATPGEGFVAHYGTMPLGAFHLAPAFTPTEQKLSRKPSHGALFELAQEQFRSWGDAFRSCLQPASSGKVHIRVFICDALAFVRALRAKSSGASPATYPRVSPWRAAVMSLDGPGYANDTAPLQFDVIDTSNLSDHLGILNVLIGASPLLKRSPSSVLYTETLLSYGEDPIMAFSDNLCCDVTTMSILLDLSPSSYISGYTTASNIHEIIIHHAHASISEGGSQGQYHERLAWKLPSRMGGLDRPVSFASRELAQLLFKIYLKLFASENMSRLLQAKRNLASLQERERIHYCRSTFVLFVALLMNRIAVDWDETIRFLIQFIIDDRSLIVGMNYYQELLVLFHVHRIYDEGPFIVGNHLLVDNEENGPFRSWSAIPPMCTVTLSVPRTVFKLLDEDNSPKNPIFALELCGPSFSNIFSIDVMFGTLSVEGSGENAKGVIDEDPLGKLGNQPMLVSACVPSWILAQNSRILSVAVKIISTPSTSTLSRKLGLQMYLHKVPLSDRSSVFVLKDRPATSPDTRAEVPYVTGDGRATLADDVVIAAVDGPNDKITTLTSRAEFNDAADKAVLASKESAVTVKQVGPSIVRLTVGSLKPRSLSFPYVVGGTNLKTRVARKSSWVEVVATPTILGRSDIDGGISKRFPVVRHNDSFLPWNIHYTYLDRLPALSMSNTQALEWLSPHVSFAFSDRERRAREAKTMEPLTHLKDSLHALFVRGSGIQGDIKIDVFGLNRTSDGGIDTLLFINDFRLDLPRHTVVVDAFALPLHLSYIKKVLSALDSGSIQVCQINLSDEEHVAWKVLLPSLVERCRTWKHKASCAYKKAGVTIPLSMDHGELPICDCGRGNVTDSFRRRKEWLPFLPYVTRVAISPLFAVSYLEPVGADIAQMVGSSMGRSKASRVASSSTSGTGPCCGACKVSLAPGKQMVCSKCKKMTYCSKACQVKDWKNHKGMCKKS